MSLFLEYVGKIERHYGTDVALGFVRANDAITVADASRDYEEAYNVRVEEITNLVDIFNASGGLPDHKLTVERMSPKAIRVILNGLMVLCGDVMYSKKILCLRLLRR